MRWTWLTAIALTLAPTAWAQEAQHGYGAFRFGMTPEEARAADASLEADADRGGDLVVLRSRRLESFGTLRIAPKLDFRNGRLTNITFNAAGTVNSAESCARVYDVVLSDLEQRLGPFNGAPAPSEYGAAASERTTAAGSTVRAYTYHRQQLTHANRRASGWIEVTVQSGAYPGLPENALICEIVIDFRPQGPPDDPHLAPPTPQQLAAARVLDDPMWNEQPNSDAFEMTLPQYYPEESVAVNVQLDCLLIAGGRLNCAVASEQPAGGFFGEFALRLSRNYRTATMVDGRSVIGRRVRVPVTLTLQGPNEEPPPAPPPRPEDAALRALVAQAPSAEALAAAPMIERAFWIERPDAQVFARYYPVAALEAGVQGRATLDCLIGADGRLRCAIAEEDPEGQGFGLAALGIAQDFRMAPEVDGQTTSGKRVRVPIRFNIAQ